MEFSLSNFSLFSIISVAFLNSFSHCYAMCGGLNLAFLRLNHSAKHPFLLSLTYHAFRILGYILLGALASFLSLGFAFSNLTQGLFLFALGVFLMLLGIALILRGKLLAGFEKLAFFGGLSHFILKRARLEGVKGACALGFANAFVPCALVYFFLASAMSASNLADSLLIMLIFGLSTLPALLFLTQIHIFLNEKVKKILACLSALIIILYGIYLAFTGFQLTR